MSIGPPACGSCRQPRAAALALAVFAAACGGPPADLPTLLAAHERTEPRPASSLRLVHDVRWDGCRARNVTTIRRAPFAYREELTGLEPPREPSVLISDGRIAFRARPGQPGEPLTGDAARIFLARAFMAGRLYFEPGPAGERRHFRGLGRLDPDMARIAGFPADRQLFAIDCPTRTETDLRVLFDPDDQHLLGWLESRPDRHAWARYTDHTRYGGLLLPKTTDFGAMESGRRYAWTLTDVAIDPPLDDALFAGHPYASGRPVDGGPLRVVAGDVPGVAWLFAEPVAVNGRDIGSALVDTGASSNVISKQLADELALPAGSTMDVATFIDHAVGKKRWVDVLQCGARPFHQCLAMEDEFGGSPALLHDDTKHFTLGADDLLRDGPVFDLAAGRLRFRSHPVPPLRAAGTSVRVIEVPAIRRAEGSPLLHVKVSVHGVEVLALFDTGFRGTLWLSATAADRVGVSRTEAARDRPAIVMDVSGLGPGSREQVYQPLESFDLGNLRFADVWVATELEASGVADQLKVEALVGSGVLLAFPQVGIDTDRAVLEFVLPEAMVPGSDGVVKVPSPGVLSGLFLTATGKDRPPSVSSVMPGSVADLAGLQVGDRVVTIGGVVVAAQDLSSCLRRLWLQPGQQVAVDVFREGSDQPRRFVLRP